MIAELKIFMEENSNAAYPFLKRCTDAARNYLLRTDLINILADCQTSTGTQALAGSIFEKLIKHTEEAVVKEFWICMAVRLNVGEWIYIQFQGEQALCKEISLNEFLLFKERIIEPQITKNDWCLELDVSPFKRVFPHLKQKRSIGNGVEFMNRHLARTLTGDVLDHFLEFLKLHQYQGVQLLLNRNIKGLENLQQSLHGAQSYLNTIPEDTPWQDFSINLPANCFEQGWGRTAKQVNSMMGLLLDILESPGAQILEEFLCRIPMVSKLAILSPHGYFGQANVLGLPDTGGQVVYILDQVRALEKQMRHDLYEQGLEITPKIIVVTRLIPEAGDTTCNQRIEQIIGTENAWILRVPFRHNTGEVVPHWISRFEIWPYLEQYTNDVQHELASELNGKPDLIVGNYSDGNLVASLLSQRMGVTQCNIAHALEKTKYLYSALYWKEHEEQYHFSCQFTADLLAMNSADFIITSTYQEIAGTDFSVGQYESYSSFTMPDLYRIINGVNVYDPKFNIVSPGADSTVYFPYSDHSRRLTDLQPEVLSIIYGSPNAESRGELIDRDKPLLFAMSRLDTIKNVTGLLEWYGKNTELQNEAYLFIVAGKVDPSTSSDAEEQKQAAMMHDLFETYKLDDKVRWVNSMSDRHFNGEMYRVIADKRGAFIQPALFEAFGLTVIEAMSTGLPVFATCFGGPLEIIKDGKSGFHIDPTNGDATSAIIANFMKSSRLTQGYWDDMSNGALERVEAAYTWQLYAKRLLTLSRIYGFWKYITNVESEELKRYLEMFYGLMYRPLSQKITDGSPHS